jgi:hypothetical protein
LLSTLFTDFSGFFTEAEADEFLKRVKIKHYAFMPIIQEESRMVIMFTSKNDAPISRVPGITNPDREKLVKDNVHTAKDLLLKDPAALGKLGLDVQALRDAAIKLLFP